MIDEAGTSTTSTTRCSERRIFVVTGPFAAVSSALSYDIAPDDQRFVFIQQGKPTQINVVLNWFEELKRLVPTGE